MSTVIPLFQAPPDRTTQIRHWFMDQGMEPSGYLAALTVAITAEGIVNTKGCGIEPEHASIILAELKALVGRLERLVHAEAPGMPSNVVPLRH